MATITAGVRDALITIYIGMFKEAPGKAALSDMVTKYESGMTQKQIATELATTAAFQNEYPASQLAREFADELVEWLADEATAAGKAWATNWIVAQLGAGKSKAHMIVEAVNALHVATNLADFGAAQDNLNNKLEVARYYAVTKEGEAPSAAVLAPVTSDADSVAAGKAVADGASQAYNLTNDVDVATANVFNSQPLYTPGGNNFINSLQDEDVLTGFGENPTLNVILGSVNDNAEYEVAPTLNNIQTVNVQITGNSGGINFQDATGLENLHLTRLTQTNGEAWFSDLDSTTTNLSISNVTRGGDVHFHYREEVLTGTDEELNLAINSARVSDLHLASDDDGGADDGFFFETFNVTTTGNNDIDEFRIAANGREDLLEGNALGTTRQVLNIVANGTPQTGSLEINRLESEAAGGGYYTLGLDELHIVANARVDIAADKLADLDPTNDGLFIEDVDTITIVGAANVMLDGVDMTAFKQATQGVVLTIDGSEMTGDLKLGVATASDYLSSTVYAYRNDVDVEITSGSGDDQIHTYGDLAGNITTNEGDDVVFIRSESGTGVANIEGVSTIDTGAGDDLVVAYDLLATAEDADQVENEGYDDVRAAAILTGDGDDVVVVNNLRSARDWDNKNLEDANEDDLYVFVGASISTGDGDDVVGFHTAAEGALIDTGAGDDVLNVELHDETVLAADTDADQETVKTTSNAGTREVQAGDDTVADRLGAVVDMGEGYDVANFIDSTSLGWEDSIIVGRDAELRSAEVMNVVALDEVTVTTTTSMVDQDAETDGEQFDINPNVIGTQILNLTIENQIDAATATATGAEQNDNFEWDGAIYADIMRFDDALEQINLVSKERTMLQNPATEIYEAGSETDFELYNLRKDIDLTLQANEATGVTAGKLVDDSLLVINRDTGVVTTNSSASDVDLYLDYDDARGLDDTAVLHVAAASGAFDLNLTIGSTTTDVLDTDGDGNSATFANDESDDDDDVMMVENFAIKFADAQSHSINANGFGDVAFRGVNDRPAAVADDVSSTAATSFKVWSAAGAGKTIAIDEVNADLIEVMNVDGSAVTAANVVLRVDAENNYTIVTGSGTDTIDMRADNVRSDDISTAVDRADRINTGLGRDVLIVNGSDSLGVNNNIEGGVASTIIDDDVFATLRGIEKILIDADYNVGGETLDITLDEQAAITGVDTISIVGEDDQELNLLMGNNFVVQTTADNVNGQLTSASSALVIDASRNIGTTELNIESKDDDSDIQLINMDIRVHAKGGTAINLVNSGDTAAQVELRVYTADENDAHVISSGNAGNADGLIDINVQAGSFDKLVVLEGSTANDNSGAEGAMTIAIDDAWTGSTFTVDASAVLNTDADTSTGGATITAAVGDTAVLNISGTQNDDSITGGRGGDTINGNAGNDVIIGDEVIEQHELEVVTFADTYDDGDVITVTHDGTTHVYNVAADGTTGATVAAYFAGQVWGSATAAADAPTRQLRLTGNNVGVDYVVTASTDNSGDNVAQVQTLSIVDGDAEGDYNVQIVFNGQTYSIVDAGPTDLSTLGTYAALNAAVTALGGTLSYVDGLFAGPDSITITGPADGSAFPLITQAIQIGAEAVTLTLTTVTNGDQGTDQPDPLVVTETNHITVVGAADTINGGAGNDRIAGLTGGDTLDGGAGFDILDYSLSLGGVNVNLATNTASGGDAQGDIISNFEGVWGSAYNDVLTGDANSNVLVGGRGDDVLSGGAGQDWLYAGEGADTVTGGAGDDWIYLGVDTDEDVVVVSSGSGADLIYDFVSGIDKIQFSDFADRDLLPATLLQQTAATGANDSISGANTELLVATGNTHVGGAADMAALKALVAAALDSAFDVSNASGLLADGKVIFALHVDSDEIADFIADGTLFGYYTDVGTGDDIAAADIEILGFVDGALLTANDFWLPTV